MKNCLELIILIWNFSVYAIFGSLHDHYKQIPKYPSNTRVLQDIEYQRYSQNKILQQTNQMRITSDFSGLNGLSSEISYFLTEKLIPVATTYISQYLQVQRQMTKLYIPENKCYLATIPESIKLNGAESDLIIFVTSLNSEENKLAWATACYISILDDRPIAGQLNINPTLISLNSEDWDYQFKSIVHEIIHILGFSDTLFDFFKDSSNVNLTKQNVVRQVVLRGISTKIVVLQKVVDVARQYFNCSDLEGLELENEGSSATQGSHWERRILQNEIMTGNYKKDMVLTQFTLAFLEGTGWYQVYYEKADQLQWGKNKGCSFIRDKCINTEQQPIFNEFCINFNQNKANEDCTSDRNYKGICQAYAENTTISQEFNYFNNEIRSFDFLSDNCPYVIEYKGEDCRVNLNNRVLSIYQEKRGLTSKCFKGNYVKQQYQQFFDQQWIHAGCHEYNCELQNDNYILTIHIEDNKIICPQEGGMLEVKGNYIGEIECPKPEEFCKKIIGESSCVNSCSGNGQCNNGKCVCNQDWYGEDCQIKFCENSCSGNGVCNQLTGLCSCNDGWGGRNCSEPTLKMFCDKCGGGALDCYGDECRCLDLPKRDCSQTEYGTNFYVNLSSGLGFLVLFILVICVIQSRKYRLKIIERVRSVKTNQVQPIEILSTESQKNKNQKKQISVVSDDCKSKQNSARQLISLQTSLNSTAVTKLSKIKK